MLTRCSRGTAGCLFLPGATHFIQVERIAAIYNHYHAWMDVNLPKFDESSSEEGTDFGLENVVSPAPALPVVS